MSLRSAEQVSATDDPEISAAAEYLLRSRIDAKIAKERARAQKV